MVNSPNGRSALGNVSPRITSGQGAASNCKDQNVEHMWEYRGMKVETHTVEKGSLFQEFIGEARKDYHCPGVLRKMNYIWRTRVLLSVNTRVHNSRFTICKLNHSEFKVNNMQIQTTKNCLRNLDGSAIKHRTRTREHITARGNAQMLNKYKI